MIVAMSSNTTSRKARKLERRTRALEYKLSEKEVLEEIISSVTNEVSVYENEYNMLPSGRTLLQKFLRKKKGQDFNLKDLIELIAALKGHLQDLLKKREVLEMEISKLNRKIQHRNVSNWEDVSDVLSLVFRGNSDKEEVRTTRFSLYQDSIKPLRPNELKAGMHVYCRKPGGSHHHGLCLQGKRKGLYMINFNGAPQTGGWGRSSPRSSPRSCKTSITCTTCTISQFCNDAPIYVARYKYEAPPYVIQSRGKRVLQTGGDPHDFVDRNSEHLASWCVTGVGRRLQMNDFLFERMQKVEEVAEKLSAQSDRVSPPSSSSSTSTSTSTASSPSDSSPSSHQKDTVMNSLMHLPYPLLQMLANFVHAQGTKYLT